MDGRCIKVTPVPADLSSKELRSFFGTCGRIEKLSCKPAKAAAYVLFETEEGAQSAVRQSGKTLAGNAVRVAFNQIKAKREEASGKGAKSDEEDKPPPLRSVCVDNLPGDTTQEEL